MREFFGSCESATTTTIRFVKWNAVRQRSSGEMDNTAKPNALKFTLKRQLDEARRQTDAIFDIISPAAFYERPIEERHRIIFYLGHLETFDWNMIGRISFGLKPLHQEFEQLFSFGIDPVDGNLPHDKPSEWPDASA